MHLLSLKEARYARGQRGGWRTHLKSLGPEILYFSFRLAFLSESPEDAATFSLAGSAGAAEAARTRDETSTRIVAGSRRHARFWPHTVRCVSRPPPLIPRVFAFVDIRRVRMRP